MESQTAFWFLAVLAQVVATVDGFLIVAFIFWLSTPTHFPQWRHRLAIVTMVLFVFGMVMVLLAVITILDVSTGTVISSFASGTISALKYLLIAYLVAVALLVGEIIWIGAMRKAEAEFMADED